MRGPLRMNNVVLYAVAVLIWGSTWFAIEFQLGVVEPEVSILYRYALAACLLFAWSAIRGLSLRFPWRAHLWFALLGILLFSLNYMLAYRAQVFISSALCAIAFSMILWMNIVNARLFFGIRSTPQVTVGALLGVAGVLTLFAPQVGELTLSDSVFGGLVLAMLGAASASFGNIASQHVQQQRLPVVQSNAWGMFYGTLWTAGYVLYKGYEFTWDSSPVYAISLFYLAVFGSVVAFGAYLTLVGRIGAHRAGYATVMFPVVALLLSYLFEGLQLDAPTIVGALMAVGGNVLVMSAPVRPVTTQTVEHSIEECDAAPSQYHAKTCPSTCGTRGNLQASVPGDGAY